MLTVLRYTLLLLSNELFLLLLLFFLLSLVLLLFLLNAMLLLFLILVRLSLHALLLLLCFLLLPLFLFLLLFMLIALLLFSLFLRFPLPIGRYADSRQRQGADDKRHHHPIYNINFHGTPFGHIKTYQCRRAVPGKCRSMISLPGEALFSNSINTRRARS